MTSFTNLAIYLTHDASPHAVALSEDLMITLIEAHRTITTKELREP